ncbi:hypothetical protein CA983_39410, partial [Streptomyces swartbergensis]
MGNRTQPAGSRAAGAAPVPQKGGTALRRAADPPRPGQRRGAQLHPAAWWLWSLSLGTAATRTTNPLLLTVLITVSAYVVATRRPDTPWSRSYGAFVKLALAVLLIRLLFATVLGSPIPGTHT